MFTGRWYITAGLNPLFDTFPCQEHYFGVPEPGTPHFLHDFLPPILWKDTPPFGLWLLWPCVGFAPGCSDGAVLRNVAKLFFLSTSVRKECTLCGRRTAVRKDQLAGAKREGRRLPAAVSGADIPADRRQGGAAQSQQRIPPLRR